MKRSNTPNVGNKIREENKERGGAGIYVYDKGILGQKQMKKEL